MALITIPSPSIKLRDYQEKGLNEARRLFGEGAKSVLLCSPTGSGKGTVAAYVLSEAAAKGNPSIFVVHRQEIVVDVAQRLRRAGAHVGVLQAGLPEDPTAMVQVCSVQTLFARGARPRARFVFWDEAHHTTASSYRKVRDAYPEAKHIGATATPVRADGKALSSCFDAMVTLSSVKELQDAGWLVPCTVKSPEERLGHDLAQDPVDMYERWTPGERAFMFVRSGTDAHHYASLFNARGHGAVVIGAKTPKRAREILLKQFQDGLVRVVVNVNTMTEGVDVPEAVTCILARKMESVSQYIQATGRVLRASKGKTHAYVLDLCGNSRDHGLPSDNRQFDLHKGIVCLEDDDENPVIPCKRCQTEARKDTFAWDGDGCPTCGFKNKKREYHGVATVSQTVLNVPMYDYGEQLSLPLQGAACG